MIRLLLTALIRHCGTFRPPSPQRVRVRRLITIYIGLGILLASGAAIQNGDPFAMFEAILLSLWFLQRMLDEWASRYIRRFVGGDAAPKNRAP